MKLPLDHRTVVFALLTGSLLSAPLNVVVCGVFEDVLVDLPEWTQTAYQVSLFGSLVLLPIWCDWALAEFPILRRLGFGLTICGIVVLLFLFFFPLMR